MIQSYILSSQYYGYKIIDKLNVPLCKPFEGIEPLTHNLSFREIRSGYEIYVTLDVGEPPTRIFVAHLTSDLGRVVVGEKSTIKALANISSKCCRSRKFLLNRYFILYQYPSRLHSTVKN